MSVSVSVSDSLSLIVVLTYTAAPPGIAAELLATPDKDLEANARKIKHICKEDLEYIVQQGRFDLGATRYGNILWTILNSLADVWANDTELVESINSIIRLIGTRSPRIELSSMSARIMIKKTVLPLQPQKKAAAKKWSIVRSFAQPLLQEMIQSGNGFKQVLAETYRFTTVAGVSLAALHEALADENQNHRSPCQSGFSPEALQWAHQFAIKWKRGVDKVGKSDKSDKSDNNLGVVRLVSLQVLKLEAHKRTLQALADVLLQDNCGDDSGPEDGDGRVALPGPTKDAGSCEQAAKPDKQHGSLAYVRAASCRSRLLMAIMQTDADSWLQY